MERGIRILWNLWIVSLVITMLVRAPHLLLSSADPFLSLPLSNIF